MTCSACGRRIDKKERAFVLYRASGGREAKGERHAACVDCIESKSRAGLIVRVSAVGFEPVSEKGVR